LLYRELAEVYDKVSQTTKRLEITDILVDFFKRCPREILDKVVYLSQGRIYPEFVPLELGVADRLIERSIAHACALPESRVHALYKEMGDLGSVAEELLKTGQKQSTLDAFSKRSRHEGVTVERVYDALDKMARAQGEGSQETKIRLLSEILSNASPREALYVVRTVSGALRLGVADMTILDALSLAFCGSKECRAPIERAYNLTSDLGSIAKKLSTEGIGALKALRPSPGQPIRSMLAERLSSAEEIIEKMGGKCAVEYKYDGERVQVHSPAGGGLMLFSRRLELINSHYPDIMRLAAAGIGASSYIVEGEIVVIDPDSGDLLPFQELMHRRRKYGVADAMSAYPAALRLFDVMFLEGEDYTDKPYPQRRASLSKVVNESSLLRLAEQKVVDSPDALESFFEEAISNGCEGLVAKSLSDKSIYKAGARGWLWIKYKRDYKSEMMDTVDLVVVGAFMGTGKRSGRIGSLLLAAYDDEEDAFRTVCKCSTGFTDEDIKNMRRLLEKDIMPHRHPSVDSKIDADIWVAPSKVAEILGSEITLSPIHTCGIGAIRKGAGLAIRFPRFTGNWRPDKGPKDATTVGEIVEMYRNQLKKIQD